MRTGVHYARLCVVVARSTTRSLLLPSLVPSRSLPGQGQGQVAFANRLSAPDRHHAQSQSQPQRAFRPASPAADHSPQQTIPRPPPPPPPPPEMSSSCLVPVSPVAASAPLLKRARVDAEDQRLCKASKASESASPHSHTVVAAQTEANPQPEVSPFALACSDIRYAITFIQNSRRHALALCVQNQWERALAVLEKIERANDKISRQRRRKVLLQANANAPLRVFDVAAMPSQAPQVAAPVRTARKPRRSVRFSEEVLVAPAQELDRSPAPMPMLLRDEILVLRASRPIPLRNFSELWSAAV